LDCRSGLKELVDQPPAVSARSAKRFVGEIAIGIDAIENGEASAGNVDTMAAAKVRVVHVHFMCQPVSSHWAGAEQGPAPGRRAADVTNTDPEPVGQKRVIIAQSRATVAETEHLDRGGQRSLKGLGDEELA
jgi:hypothetical protein